MSDPKDVIDRAAADDLPVLTDVVDLPSVAAAAPKLPAASPSEADLRSIERQITQRVLATIQPSLSGFLEEPLRATLQSRLEQALGPLTERFKADIETIVREAVAKAVELEVSQLRERPELGASTKKSQ